MRGVALLVLLAVCAAGAQEPWQPFTSQEGRFQVLMPGIPEPQPGPREIGERGFRSAAGSGTYTVAYSDLEPAELAQGPDPVYQRARQTLLEQRKAEERAFREVQSRGLPCWELRYVTAPRGSHPGYSGLARFYLAGTRLYRLEASVPRGMSSSEVLSFAGSFRVLSEEKPEPVPTETPAQNP